MDNTSGYLVGWGKFTEECQRERNMVKMAEGEERVRWW